ncbi:Crp/Fnr family transcriptional regulator [Allosphingosinicella flava]|uniref:Crp/Fnr family transcriptional regulator n=1 Tax=Allosphingosinicella flava TaxID=2771430 RepID=A0A7T2LM19_9SPHN|nr:Crp/Fnr family transcriptional regulator [Sphingosinicella flava]QPQ55059.1 Crp/Fnr family transcriptional regulator [Sphingosinicella flava]
MPIRAESCADCPVRDSAICAALDAQELAELAAIGQTRDFKKGDTIFALREDHYVCATIVSGAAKVASIDANGIERIVALLHPAGFLGQLFATTTQHEVTAIADSRLCLFPKGGFERVMERHPALTRSILERTYAELDRSRALTDLIGRRDVKARLAGLLLALARAASPSPCGNAAEFDLPLSREEMASLIGTTIETVSRRLTSMEQDGIIARKGARGLIIRDTPSLMRLAA